MPIDPYIDREPKSLAQVLDATPPKALKQRSLSFEDRVREAFAEQAKEGKTAAPAEVVRSEEDAQIITLAARLAAAESSPRAHAMQRLERLAPPPAASDAMPKHARQEKPTGDLDERLREWVGALTDEQREHIVFSDWYGRLSDAARARLDAVVNEFASVAEPTPDERAALEAELNDDEELEYL